MAKRLFISTPVARKSNDEIIEARRKAAKYVRQKLEEDIDVIDSFFNHVPEGIAPLYVLGKCIELLSQADIVYFVKGWENYRGCRTEHQCAIEYGITIIE